MRNPAIGSFWVCARINVVFWALVSLADAACPAAVQLRRDGVESLRLVGLQEHPHHRVTLHPCSVETAKKKIVPHSPDDMAKG